MPPRVGVRLVLPSGTSVPPYPRVFACDLFFHALFDRIIDRTEHPRAVGTVRVQFIVGRTYGMCTIS